MKFLIFSDIHQDLRALEKIAATPADIYIAAGDLATWARGLDECGRVLQPLGEKLWVLPGNHESDQQIAGLCSAFGFRNFHGQAWQSGRFWFGGLGYSNPTPFNTPGEYSEQEIGARLEKFAALSPLVLVCHAPPFGTALDRIGPRAAPRHAGSSAVKSFLDRHPPAWFFCGHIHECAGVRVQLGRTIAVNAGKNGYLLHLDESAETESQN